MSEQKSTNDQRRFLRVNTASKNGKLNPLASLSLRWESGEVVKVFDMSYGGVACGVPEKEELKAGQAKSFEIMFTNSDDVNFVAEVVWVGDDFVGLNFESLSVESRLAINHFLDNKILGVSLKLVDQQFYSKQMTCQFWYQGGLGVNLYLWQTGDEITRGEVEFEDSTVVFEKDSIKCAVENEQVTEGGKNKITSKAIDILSQITVEEVNVSNFLKETLQNLKKSKGV